MFLVLSAVFLLSIVLAFFFRARDFLPLSCGAFIVFLGALHFGFADIIVNRNIPFGKDYKIEGVIYAEPEFNEKSQDVKIRLSEPYDGNLLVKIARFPEFAYGDLVEFYGEIKPVPFGSYGNYLKKEKICGVVSFPETTLISGGHGSRVRIVLLGFKGLVSGAVRKTLSYEKAALLQGILLGDTGDFSESFRENMRASGTTHIVALSGYNISIVALAAVFLFSRFLAPTRSFILSSAFIAAFVLMTGASPSVTRAGIMGVMLLFGKLFGNGDDLKNVLILSALGMIIANPRVLVFDAGFQLSFAAFLGIAYLKPHIERTFGIVSRAGMFSWKWKENLLSTVSAQVAVLPIIMSYFDSVALVSIPANVVMLTVMPATMTLGFLTVLVSLAIPFLSALPGTITEFLLQFEISVINFSSALGGKISFRFSPVAVVFYYVALVTTLSCFARMPRFLRRERTM